MRAVRQILGLDSGDADAECGCAISIRVDELFVDATDCPHDGVLSAGSPCLGTVVEAVGSHNPNRIRVERRGVVVTYEGRAATVLSASGAFAARVEAQDPELATRVTRDPASAARDARSRIGPIRDLAVDTGFEDVLAEQSLDAVLTGSISPTIAAARIDAAPPSAATLSSTVVLDTGATARIYETDAGPRYHLEPIEYTFDADAHDALDRAWRTLGASAAASPHDAIASVSTRDLPTTALGRVLEKHTQGYGVLEDLFADSRVDELFVNAPADEMPLHVLVDDRTLPTNVRLTERGAELLASRVRMASGSGFSRAEPTVDALLTDLETAGPIRVAGVQPPASAGLAFALREEATDEWRLSTLVALETLSPSAAGFLSVAIERGAATLVAGPRGGGKTTLAATLLWELPRTDRLIALEDTPELPVHALQSDGRDVQRLTVSSDDGGLSPADALRTALRFGDGALAVGEVRGEEAAVLYEAMRVGAASSAVLGTIHGRGADGVRERVVSDLGVPESSFLTTDLVVTIVPDDGARRVSLVEEVTERGPRVLYERGPEGLVPSGRIARGESEFMASIAGPSESYASVRAELDERVDRFEGERPPVTVPPAVQR
ncbi:MAG: ATPase, T2SS/T4P/T4SS family [Halanaeroarchaeum sp.]